MAKGNIEHETNRIKECCSVIEQSSSPKEIREKVEEIKNCCSSIEKDV